MRIALVLGLVLLGLSVEAAAQPKRQIDAERRLAADHFRKGQAAQSAGRFREAIAAYEQAYDLVPHSNTLFNIAFCYEQLGEWSQAVDYYERYLSEPGDHRDAAAVTAKLDELRARIRAVSPPPTDEPSSSPVVDPTVSNPTVSEPNMPAGPMATPMDQPVVEPTVDPSSPPRSRGHLGVSYGVGFGDAPTERFLGYGGIQIADRLEIDAILGKFGKNDLAIGIQGKVLLEKLGRLGPFGRGAITIGYARQDASSGAESRFPVGFEAGGGLLFGARGRLELAAVVRWTRGGFDMTSTAVDSYVNDTFAFAIDLGFAFDLPNLASVKTADP